MSTTGLAPRLAAYHLLNAVTIDGRLLSEEIGGGALSRLSPEDRARAQRLAISTLRAADRADRMLKPFLQKRPPLSVRNAMRLGTVEIWSGEAAHGVVNACVEIVGRDKKTQSMKGLVNAVLRKVAAEREGAWDRLPIPRLPDWLRLPMIEAWGKPAVSGMEAAHYAGAPLDITVKSDAAGWAEKLGGQVLPTGTVRIPVGVQVSGLPGFEDGEWWVQDAAAALPVKTLGDIQGLNVLDLCAAPGGKTMQLAAAGAKVTAVDISPSRLDRVQENLERTKMKADLIDADALVYDVEGFDVVLLDAPCSATGTIRRHPDLPHAKDGSEFGDLIALQTELIDHALTLLKPGGRLVFCTCSLLPDEGEVQVEEALERHEGLTVEKPEFEGLDPAWITEEGGVRLRPDYWAEFGGMDGFYLAVLTKAA
ncbi:RsmB/NOP family class I SAM-dependent RNA methyltransferase [Marivivens aquimaris]|uniref:RsmB/NOP family class I SAM-dependent RNA methyltransferase n=1 Tax=Marivivens aquimaris TaxID=2774876 RepID=UPI001881D101|nr:RsmB/NOP family class I SAM-dependent RNA methyltransferase [Marivivens aquimaris]